MATSVIETLQSKPPVMNVGHEKSDSQSDAPTLHDPTQDVNRTNAEDDTPKDDEIEYLTGWKLTSLMISITLAAFLMLLDMSIIVTAIPRITSDFHSLRDVGWYGSSYNLASAALQPLSGKIYTYFKSKWIFLGCLFVFELGCLVSGVANSSVVLIIGRTISGIGASGIQNGALTIVAASVPLHKRPSLVGILMGGAQLGLVIGPLVGGAFTQYTTWRWCFYINLPIGAICTILVVLVKIPDRRVRTNETVFKILTTKLDFTGFVLFAPCTVMFLLALEWGGVDYAWNSATVIGLFCGGAGLFVVFIFWERHVGAGAMIPLPIIRKREVWTACLTQMFLFATVIVASFYMPIYFQSITEASPFDSGVNMLPSILSQLASAACSGVLAQKVGYYIPFAALSGAISAIGNGLLSTLGPHTPTAKWAGYQILVGFGRGIGMQMSIIAVQANTSPDVTSVATAVLVFSQVFGGAIFVSMANVIFNSKLHDELVARLPDVDASAVIDAGAAALRDAVGVEDLPQALLAYSEGVRAAFLLAVAASCGMFITSWGMGWNDIRKKAPVKAGDA
ncbi:hypothetical protein FZEAL_4000 [Fusarium zealandicum]|uniref:Major facilitator superfamily (MFS) profile domain-containing protein n=1 Tax=Fusarium zealandicum TaxID=1053134 RepID=A0A8H4XLW2_9HYPO|nr:hypothetical protein FZEAL_4000 [Fusarium zealandicum]